MTSTMKIESISQKSDRAGQYYVKLSDGTTLRLYPQTVAEFHLYAGREVEAEELEALRQAAGAASARMRAVRIVSAAAVSTRDLERRLRRKGETEADAQAAVAWMQDLHLVDDLDTARQLVRRGLARGYGPGRLRQMLYEKQIPRELWDQVLEDLPEPDEAITAFLDRRLSPEPDRRELQKTIDALLRRGFAWQDIRRCLSRRGESVDGEPEE